MAHQDQDIPTDQSQVAHVHQSIEDSDASLSSAEAGLVAIDVEDGDGSDDETPVSKSSTEHDNDSDAVESREEGFEELCDHVRSLRIDPSEAQGVETNLATRTKEFHHARELRRNQYNISPYGIFALFANLADLRTDLEWAQDSAWRRAHGKPHVAWADYNREFSAQYHLPIFTIIIILISTCLMVLSMYLNDWKFASFKVNPMAGPDPSVLIDLGALTTINIVEQNEWYRLVTPMVLHAGLIHYAINMCAMWVLGAAVERVHGPAQTALVFFVSAVGGNLASANFMLYSVSVGASGGIFGLLGLCLADVASNWELLTITDYYGRGSFPFIRASIALFVDVTLNMIIGLTPYIDNFSHLGGFFYGVCFGLVFAKRLGASGFFGQRTKISYCRRLTAGAVGILLAGCLFVFTILWLVESDGRTTVCPECRYLSCVPFPFWGDASDRWWHCDSCDQSVAELYNVQNTTELDLTCPSGSIVTIDLMDPDPVRDVLRGQLPGLCRQYCEY